MSTQGHRSDAKLKDSFVEFLKSPSNNMKYRSLISSMAHSSQRSLVVDFADLSRFDSDLAVELQKKPKVMLKIFRDALAEVLNVEAEVDAKTKRLNVRIRGLFDRTPIRVLNASLESKLVLLSGIVSKTHQAKSVATTLSYRCVPNGHQNVFCLDDFSSFSKLPRPYVCDECDAVRFYLDKEATEKQDFQMISIQEMPEDLEPGQMPTNFLAYAFDDLVNTVFPGERVLLTAIVQMENDGKSRTFDTRLIINHVEVIGKKPEDAPISRAEEEEFRNFAKQNDAYDLLVRSVNPAIYGHERVKEALLLQLTGSPRRQLPDGTSLRGDISILLVGDPGIAKSQLLKNHVKMAPRSFYTIGRGTTAAGLGAAVIKEPKGSFSLEAGAAVLCDEGILVIDEFSSLKQEDTAVLNEILEQQTVSLSKAGINANLNTRVGVTGAMNPIDGKYDRFKSIVENIGAGDAENGKSSS